MTSPKVSVIVPVYNVEQYLDRCVESLIAQTYKNIEIILVDDGSHDTSPQKCDAWADRDDRIYVIHKSNGGASDARNVGIDASHGEFIMFVDSDDFVSDDIISDLHILQCHTEADVACGGVYKYRNGQSYPIYNEIIHSESVLFTGLEQLKNMLNSLTDCSACGKLYKRSAIGKLRFIKGRSNEDVIFLFSLYATCSKVAYTNKRYYYYRDTAGSVTHILSNHSLQNMLDMEQMVVERDIPVTKEMENYKCRICLELAYAIQRDNARARFINQSNYAKNQVKTHLLYMIRHSEYTWKDLAHALIVLFKL